MEMEENPVGKRPLKRHRLRWEDVVGKNVKSLNGKLGQKAQLTKKESWKIRCGTK